MIVRPLSSPLIFITSFILDYSEIDQELDRKSEQVNSAKASISPLTLKPHLYFDVGQNISAGVNCDTA